MTGTKLIENTTGEVWSVVASDNGSWILAPEVFGKTNRRASVLEISADYTTDGEVTGAPSPDALAGMEQRGWEALSDHHLTKVARHPGVHVEDVFTLTDGDANAIEREEAAERIAASIVADPVKREDAQAGRSHLLPEVLTAFRKQLAKQAA